MRVDVGVISASIQQRVTGRHIMQRLDRILAVIDPTVEVQVGAAKAARLARLSGAALELFACDFDPALTGQPFDTDQLRRLREEFIADRAAYLEDLADELRAGGLDVTTHVHWDNPLHEGILRRVAEFEPDLMVKDTHSHHSLLRRALFTNTDWNLIRRCPVPLLLSRTADWSARPRASLRHSIRVITATSRLRSITTSSTPRSSPPDNSAGPSKPSTPSFLPHCWPQPRDLPACRSPRN